MYTSDAIATAGQTAAKAGSTGSPGEEIHFSDVLSALNPLQYLPGVGTIYRAVTGDVVPESLRVAGSMIAGGLMGGPVGVAIAAASSLVQHVAHIDLDHMAHDVLASIGLIHDDAPAPAAVQEAQVASPAGSATAAEGPPASDAPTRAQALAAYGQTLFTYGAGGGHA
jgi:hypothetical protein